MIFTLHRYIFRELLRVFVLTTIALTLILSLGLMLKPIQEYGVPPAQALHLLGYMLPITLTFVLPMSALFATTLIYGRFASDNEMDACRASGISFSTLVYPAFSLAVIVAVTTLILSFHVAPAFVQRSEKSVKANAKQILFRNMQRKGYYQLPTSDYVIWADKAIPQQDTLEGLIVIESKDLEITKMVTAQNAKIIFDDHGPFNTVTVAAQQTRQIDRHGQYDFGYLEFQSTFRPLMSDNIKFQKIEKLKRIKQNMMEFYPVYELAMETRTQLAAEMLTGQITAKMQNSSGDYYELTAYDRMLYLSTGGCAAKKNALIELEAPIRLLELDKVTNQLICRWDSDTGVIRLENSGSNITMEVILDKPNWTRAADQKGPADLHVVKNIELPQKIASQIPAEGILETIAAVGSEKSVLKVQPGNALTDLAKQLHNKILKTENEIASEMHSKLVLGLGSVTLILIGTALGIKFKGGYLLSAFGTSSIPAGILIVFIMAGKQLTKNPSTPTAAGPLIMWTGFFALTVLAARLYRRLLRT